MNVNSWSKVLPHQDVINLDVVFLTWACHVLLLDGLSGPRMFVSTRLLKIANSRSLRPLSFISTLQDARLLSLETG